MVAAVVREKRKRSKNEFFSMVLNFHLCCTAVIESLYSVESELPQYAMQYYWFVLCTVYLSLLVLNELIVFLDISSRSSFYLKIMKLLKHLCLCVCFWNICV